MSDLNALIAQGIQFKAPPDPFAQYAQMQQLQQGEQANQLNQMKMAEYQRNLGQQNALRGTLAGFKSDMPVDAQVAELVRGGHLTEARSLAESHAKSAKDLRDAETAQLTNFATKTKLAGQILAGVTDEASYQRALPQLAAIDRKSAAAMPPTFDPTFVTTEVQKGLELEKQLERHFQEQNLGGTVRTMAMRKFGGGSAVVVPGSVGDVTVTPSAQLTADTSIATNKATNERMASEGRLNRANAKDIANIRTTSGGLTPEQTDALYGPNGAVTLGRLDPYKVNGRTAKILADAYILNPNTDMNALGSNAGLMRNAPYMARAQTTEMLPEILSNVVTAGKKVNYSDAKFIGAVEQFAKGQMNDPDFISYMTQRNDALLTIAGVMRGNGATDQAHRAEIEAASPTMSPAALDAWLKAQMTALAPRLKQAAKVTRTPGAAAAEGLPAPAAAGKWGKAEAEK